jgi:hypothetical protein
MNNLLILTLRILSIPVSIYMLSNIIIYVISYIDYLKYHIKHRPNLDEPPGFRSWLLWSLCIASWFVHFS